MASQNDFLFSTLTKSNLMHKNPIVCRSDELASDGLQKLQTNKISSLPLFDVVQGQYFAFIDNRAFVTFALKHINDPEYSQSFKTMTCKEISKYSVANWSSVFVPINEGDSVKKALSVMVNRANLHSFQCQRDLLGIVSQSEVLKSIEKLVQFFPVTNKKVKELRLGFKHVHSVQITEPISSAFKLIIDEKVSGVAVLDGKDLVGNVSVSDIGIAGPNLENLEKLKTPLTEILPVSQRKSRILMTSPESTVKETISAMVKQRLHRIYLVSEQGTLQGVISIIDIIELLSQNGMSL